MALQAITSNDGGLDTRNKINNMFGELYASIVQPLKLPGLTGNTNQSIASNTLVRSLSLINAVGTPTIRIGTIPNGQDVMPDTQISGNVQVDVNEYFANATVFYITFTSGAGTINIRLDVIQSYY